MKTLPDDKSRETVMLAFVDSLSYQQPDIAMKWLDQISNKQTRSSRLENVARRWLESDESAAMAWIKQSSLPEQQKDRLLKNRQ